ncbi:MAG: hypothetical protein E6R10_07150 [Rhodocyclaceae bacterium]|nr:MAG: hypothetical protein E6R10_07150 [Rhodocyclaceae bacterium]
MAILSVSEASRRWRLGRSNLYRAINSGRLSLSARPDGTKGLDTSELVRVFGEPSHRTTANVPPMSGDDSPASEPDDREQPRTPSPVNLLQAQVDQLSAQLEQANEREARLLAMLEGEQQTRRDLETRLLPAPAPRPAPPGKGRLWALVILLLATLALAGWHWRDAVMAALAP